MLTWANILTSLRVFIAPAFFYFVITGESTDTRIAIVLFGVGALTDFFDGYLARRLGEESELGNFLDPLADKILVLSAFFAFVFLEIAPLWLVLVIIARDAATTAIRVYADSKGRPLVTSRSAKWKTALQLIYVFAILLVLGASRSTDIEGLADVATSILKSDLPLQLLFFLALFSVVTFAQYIVTNRHLFRTTGSKDV